MKKLLLFLAFALITHSTFAVAIERVTSTSIRFYNWSQSNFNMTGMHLTINSNVLVIDNLNIKKSGPLDVAAGTYIEFDGLTIPNSASIALWYPNAFPNNQNAGNIASFIQFGAAGHPYEAIADAAGLWTTGTFIPGMPPFIRDQDYNTWGAGNWSQGLSETEFTNAPRLSVYPNPFSAHINLTGLSDHIVYASITDASGKIYLVNSSSNNEDVEFDTTYLKNGTYILRVKLTDGSTVNRRLLKI